MEKSKSTPVIITKPAAEKAGKKGKSQQAKDDKSAMVSHAKPSYVIQTKHAGLDEEKKEEIIRRKMAGGHKSEFVKQAVKLA